MRDQCYIQAEMNIKMSAQVSTTAKKPLPSLMIAIGAILVFAAIMAGITSLMISASFMDAPATIKLSAMFLGAGFFAAVMAILSLSRISVWNVSAQILPMWFSITLVIAVSVMAFRLDYSIVFLGFSWPAGLVVLLILGRMLSGHDRLIIGILPNVDQSIVEGHEVVIIKDQTIPAEKLDLVLATRADMTNSIYAGMLSALAGQRIPVLPQQSYREQVTGRVDHHEVDAAELMQLRPYRRYMMIKRLSDIIMASVGIILLSPLMVVVAVMIKLESSGPAIFIQRRVGESGREFKMYKFRSMVQDAEKSGAKFATASDARITSLGRIIRKLRIDELPQLFNVLMGTMSMIGPRPEQKAFVEDLEKEIPLYPIRHAVRPGITGWAQVMQGYADDVSSTDVKLSYDLFYIKNLSLMMDMVIFFKTIKTIITGFGRAEAPLILS